MHAFRHFTEFENGDRRANDGDVFRALAIGARSSGDERLSEYAFDGAAVRLRAAVQSTVAAADLDAAPLDVRAVEDRVRRGDASAYVKISDAIDDLRNQSIEKIKELRARTIGELAFIYAAHIFFNILGVHRNVQGSARLAAVSAAGRGGEREVQGNTHRNSAVSFRHQID